MISEAGLAVLIVILAYLIMRFMRFNGTYYCLIDGNMMKFVVKDIKDKPYYDSTNLPELEKKLGLAADHKLNLSAEDFAKGKWYITELYELVITDGLEDFKYVSTSLMLKISTPLNENNELTPGGTLIDALTINGKEHNPQGKNLVGSLFLRGLTWYIVDTVSGKPMDCSKEII